MSQDYFGPGARVRVDGLSQRADLNGQEAEVVHWVRSAGRWAIELGTGEGVRVRPINLTLTKPAPGAPEPIEDEDEPVVLKKEDGSAMMVFPERSKRRFEETIQKYQFQQGNASERINDFLFKGGAVTAEGFAQEFGTSNDDAEAVLSWINVSIAIREQVMQPAGDLLGAASNSSAGTSQT